MPSVSDLAHVNNDEAEKIPNCYGFWNAFCVPVVCLPIFGLLMLCFPCIKRKRKKLDVTARTGHGAVTLDEEPPPPTAEEVAAVATVVAQSIPAIPSAVKEEREYRAQGGMMMEQAKRRPAGPPPDPETLAKDPQNPRICDGTCPGYTTPGPCPAHNQSIEGPASPGLLAV
ncbi:hypothetical protein CPLU01_12133 [Colletotrichum plurivorum]|uniref:Uncharacterized protein n=1 Tax=Colletotrichum plurivorum TaxID=2175906 RepID=A0A8H6N7E6_9PEZI|nr:hypothetical protein CPLU01_12133 [Colletotrichum plurivorum]